MYYLNRMILWLTALHAADHWQFDPTEKSCCLVVLQMHPGESFLVKPITMCESGTQTDIHPVESNMVKSYEWNEWELRRKAIKLVSQKSLDGFQLIYVLGLT